MSCEWHAGRKPTREETLQEFGNLISERRNEWHKRERPGADAAALDRLMRAYWLLQELPRGAWE